MRQNILGQSDISLTSTASMEKSNIKKSALLQVDIADSSARNKINSALKVLEENFATITILLDTDLALLSSKIITPYMREAYLKEIVAKKKSQWLSKHMHAINQLTKPWSIVTTEDKCIQKAIKENTLSIECLIAKDNTMHEEITKDATELKEYLTDNHNITSGIYKQTESENDKNIEMYLMRKIAVIQSMCISDSHTYISINDMLSYTYLIENNIIQNLPSAITLTFTKPSDDNETELVSSTELNQSLHNFDLLGSIAENKSYMENSFKYFKGHAYIYSAKGNCLSFNPQQSLSLGIIDESYFEGKHFSDIYPQEEAGILLQTSNRTIKENSTQVLKEKYTYPQKGEEITFLSIKTPLRNKKNKAIGIIGFSMPIDQHKEPGKYKASEPENVITNMIQGHDQSLQEAIKSIPGHIFWQDLDGKIIGCNNYQANFFGFEKAEDLVGQSIYDFLTESNIAPTKKDLEEIVRTTKPIVQEEIYKSSHGLKAMMSHKTPVKDNDGKIAGVMVIAIDISGSKEKELALETEKEHLEIARSFKSQFIKDIENDMRVPFLQLCNMTELYARKEKDKDKKKHLHEISNCAKELLSYCDALLEFGKKSSIPNNNSPISLHDVAQSIIKTSIIAIRAKRLNFDFKYDESIPNKVIGDVYRLKSILSNLMSNAVKFTDQGYIRLSIKLHSYKGNKINILFSVIDSGTGISQETKQKILNKYNTLTHTNRKLSAGLGVGLNEVKRFVEDLQGDLNIDSSHETGTEIKIQLPFTMCDNCDDVKSLNSEISKKILIVDESMANKAILEDIASNLGCYSNSVSSSTEAIMLLENEEFDLVLLGLDDIDSYTLAYRIREMSHQHTKIIMMTAPNPKSNPNINEKLDITASFIKPAKVAEVTRIIKNTMEPETV